MATIILNDCIENTHSIGWDTMEFVILSQFATYQNLIIEYTYILHVQTVHSCGYSVYHTVVL